MSLVERCWNCSDLLPRCQCDANPIAGAVRDNVDVIPREAHRRAEQRFREKGTWL